MGVVVCSAAYYDLALLTKSSFFDRDNSAAGNNYQHAKNNSDEVGWAR
jgi:hypothetical protein